MSRFLFDSEYPQKWSSKYSSLVLLVKGDLGPVKNMLIRTFPLWLRIFLHQIKAQRLRWNRKAKNRDVLGFMLG